MLAHNDHPITQFADVKVANVHRYVVSVLSSSAQLANDHLEGVLRPVSPPRS
jgi:hypothetical protein